MTPSRTNSSWKSPGGILASLRRFWNRSYASDYVGFTVLLIAYFLIQFFVEPFHRMFAIGDLRISFPHAEIERVPLTLNFVYALFIPLGVLLLYNALSRSSAHKYHVTILGLAIALILASFLTDLIKNLVGRPRPDLIARCKPAPNTPRDVLVTIDVCRQTAHHTLHDGWRSFPSGHSSFSFAGLGYLALFLAGQMRIFAHGISSSFSSFSSSPFLGPSASSDEPKQQDRTEKLVRGDLGHALLCLSPLLGSTWIAISRCQDYRHDVYDVCIGALLGWAVAYWSYRRYWPRLSSPSCNEPYPSPPVAAVAATGEMYGRLRDEEERGNAGRG